MQDLDPKIVTNILHETGLDVSQTVTEEDLLQALAIKIAALLERSAEEFFQLMYRLDIPEHKLYEAMNTGDAPHAIAHLIYLRQLQKIQSRKENKPGYSVEDKDLEW